MTEDGIWHHTFIFHNSLPSAIVTKLRCPVCGKKDGNFSIHLHDSHGPVRKGLIPPDQHASTLGFGFALVVCRRKRDGKYLLVQEVCSWGWWLPGGRVDAGESFEKAAIRETKEEAGIDIRLSGILRFEFTNREKYSRTRVIFLAEPIDEYQSVKSFPDWESTGAAWVDPIQLKQLALRGSEPIFWISYLEAGKPFVAPLGLLTDEGSEELIGVTSE